MTDDGPAIQSAVNAADTDGGGDVYFPPPPSEYLVETGVLVPSHVHIFGDGDESLILNNAVISGVGNHLFHVRDATDVSIRDLRIEAVTTLPRVGATLAGVVENITLAGLTFRDHKNFSVQYADSEIDPTKAFFHNVYLERINIDGDTGAVGAGSGINIFPRSQIGSGSAAEPSSSGLFITDLYVDVTRGFADESEHGPQCLKINNTRSVEITNATLLGGDVAGLVLSNGVQVANLINIDVSKANLGLALDGDHNTATTETRDITVQGLSYALEGVVGGDGDGLVMGNVQNVTVTEVDLEGHIRLRTNPNATQPASQIAITGGTVVGNVVVRNPSNPIPAINDLRLEQLAMVGGLGTASGRIVLSASNWPVDNSSITDLTLMEPDNHGVRVNGSGNTVNGIEILGGNPANAANVVAVFDHGADNSVRGVSLLGAHNVQYFYRRDVEGAFDLGCLSGSSVEAAGVRLANVTVPPTGDHDVSSAEMVLSGPPVSESVFVALSDCYVLGILFHYTQATSADPGVRITVGKDSDPEYFLSRDSLPSAPAGSTEVFINTVGTDSFASRDLGNGESLLVGTTGGKQGAGAVSVSVILASSC